MTAVGQRLHLRLFLEGVELPVVAANINSQKNSAAVASIQIPANDYALDLKPRTLVHLFCFDGYRGAPPESQVKVQGAGIHVVDPDKGSAIPGPDAVPSPLLTEIDLENQNYKLIFGGEVVGVSYQKTPNARAMTLQCVDWSSYWDIAYQYQMSGMSLGGTPIRAAFTGASATVFNEFLEGSADIVLKLMQTPPRSYPNMKNSLLGGLMHLIEAIGGCYYGKRAVRGTNDFFSLAEMRLHLTQMVGANPNSAEDETRLMKANGFGTLFSKTLGGLGQLVTIRQVLLALQRYIFHEIVPITAPYYIPPKGGYGAQNLETVPLSQDRATVGLVKAAQELKERALELKQRQEASTDLKAGRAQGQHRGGLERELTRLGKVADEARTRAKKVMLQGGAAASHRGLESVAASFDVASRNFGSLLSLTRAGISGAGYGFPLMGTTRSEQVLELLRATIEMMDSVLEAEYTRPAKLGISQPDPPARLFTQIYRPDVWMVAPPRCNVIFPELYSQFSYGRNFLSEVSRILLRTHEAFWGSDILFDGFYMSPSRLLGARKGKPIAAGRTNQAPDLTEAPAWVLKDMLDHELYTGITPAFERMSDLNLHAIRGGHININGAEVGYAQLVCNHLFFGYRFRSRDLMCSGKFNPYAVLGFPMVIIDKYRADDETQPTYSHEKARELAALTSGVPALEAENMVEMQATKFSAQLASILEERPLTHYLGTPELISHAISAGSGGTTQYQMGYARTTNEKTEFLGDNLGKSAKAKKTKNQKVPTVVAALEPPKLGTRGILGGKIVDVQDVTKQYTRKKTQKGAAAPGAPLLPIFVSEYGFSGRKRRGTRVPVGVELPATAYGPEVVAIAGSGGTTSAAIGEVLVTFSAYRILEEVGVYQTEDVALPPEEITFPPWYGEAYRTRNIGALYAYYFGVGAITDPTVVLGQKTVRGPGGERALQVELTETFGGDSLPPPGLSSTPEPSGGGTLGPELRTEELGEVQSRSPIADAVNEIVRIYSATRTHQYDTPAFVQTYTWRPIASMVDIFGTSDLQITDDGEVVSGREGFHSRAFSDADDLRQLVAKTGEGQPPTILGLKAKPSEIAGDAVDPSAKIASRMDTRKEKRQAVLRYLNALAASRGVLLG